MNRPKIRRIGDIDPRDLRILFESRGLEFLPYPIAQYGPRAFGSADEYTAYAAAIVPRFDDGDLAVFRPPLDIILSEPDIRVEYYSHNLDTDEPIQRVAAFRKGHQGCLLRQLGADDRVEVATLSAFDIGAAIAVMTPPATPGPLPAVTIAGYTRDPEADTPPFAEAELSVRQRVSSMTNLPSIPASDINGFGSVQTDWRPARDWGRDPAKELIRWAYTKSGAYLITRDRTAAKPLTPSALHARIDESIAADVASIRRSRGG